MMIKVTMAAPFDVRGRYKGGISSIVNAIEQKKDLLDHFGVELIRFETCRVNRENSRQSTFDIGNIKNFFKIYRDLPKEIKREGSECLYFHSSVKLALLKDLISIRRAKRKTKIPTVLHIHFADYEKIMTGKAVLDSFMLRIMKKYVDRIVFLSGKTKQEFVQHGISDAKCEVIYNFSTLEYSEEQIEAKLKGSDDNTKFLFVGSIDQRKGIFDVLECLVNMQDDYVLHICGGFNNEADESRFNEYKNRLGNKIIYHGYVDGEDKKRLFLESDVLLLPSYGEGLPVVILEAFSAACGVITTDVGAIPEIVGGENGFVLPCGDLKRLGRALASYTQKNCNELSLQKPRNYLLSRKYTISNFIKSVQEACYKAINTIN